jgi:glucan phosphoethanolaminetransferase (alkaline phosphatase superfamily)
MKNIKNKLLNYTKIIYLNKKQILFHLGFVIAFSILLIIDDWIFKLFNPLNTVKFGRWTFWGVLIATILSLSKNKKFIYTILGFYCFFDITQLAYFAYFGSAFTPFNVPLVFGEMPDIIQSGFGDFGRVYYAFIAVGVPYFLIFWLIKKYNDRLYKVKYIWIILVIVLLHFPMRAYRSRNITHLFASHEAPSVYNGVKVYSGYLFNILRKGLSTQKFEQYKLVKTKPLHDDMNIILIYGESFGWRNSSLYGYERKTMPLLTEFAKKHKNNFKYQKGISCATFTSSSIPTFFNFQREPENHQQQMNKTVNLFRMAKERNFNTFWISIQSRSMINNLAPQFIDTIKYYNNEKSLIDELEDEALLEILKRYDINDGNNFIVLHKGNLHSPFMQYTKLHKEEFGKFDIQYDNAMLYEDWLLYNIFEYFRNNSKKTFYVFLISDHGSLIGGNDGKYGHGRLDPRIADVPVMVYTNDTNKTILDKFEKIWTPTCYQFGELIADTMGYKIINPNTPDGVYYINNTDLLGRHGYIKVTKDEKNKKIEYEEIIK